MIAWTYSTKPGTFKYHSELPVHTGLSITKALLPVTPMVLGREFMFRSGVNWSQSSGPLDSTSYSPLLPLTLRFWHEMRTSSEVHWVIQENIDWAHSFIHICDPNTLHSKGVITTDNVSYRVSFKLVASKKDLASRILKGNSIMKIVQKCLFILLFLSAYHMSVRWRACMRLSDRWY